jgi:hypothetical protein
MIITLKVKPVYVSANGMCRVFKTKQAILEYINLYWTHRSSGQLSAPPKIGYNLEKRNAVIKRTKIKSGKNKGKSKSEIIKESQWVAWIYSFPKDWPVVITQHSRHFDLKQKKGF